MDTVSRWEIAGVPAAAAFSALYEVGVLSTLGISEHQVPHLMVLAYVAVALIRAARDKRAKSAKDN